MCVHSLQVVVLLCTLQYCKVSLFQAQDVWKQEGIYLILLYFSRYCTIRLRMLIFSVCYLGIMASLVA